MSLLLVWLFIAGSLFTTPQVAPVDDEPVTISFLFVQNTSSGTLVAEADGSFTLTMDDVPSTLWFTDRPIRRAGDVPTEGFLEYWSEGDNSFEADPPNAVLEIEQLNYVVELTDPSFDADTHTLSYTVTPVDEQPADITIGELASLEAMTFGTASLFIDSEFTTVVDDVTADVKEAIDGIVQGMC